jgi:hypothetical protein
MIKRAIIITLILNSIILIGVPAGHGYGIMIMFEFMSVPSLLKNGIHIQNEYPFDSGLTLTALISLIGKITLTTCLFFKNIIEKKARIFSGLAIILLPFLLVIYGAWNFDTFLFVITLGSGTPFLMYLGRVVYLVNNERDRLKVKTDM